MTVALEKKPYKITHDSGVSYVIHAYRPEIAKAYTRKEVKEMGGGGVTLEYPDGQQFYLKQWNVHPKMEWAHEWIKCVARHEQVLKMTKR